MIVCMEKNLRPIVIAGNWKMHKTIKEATQFIRELAPRVQESSVNVLLAVPYTAIYAAAKESEGTNIMIGAQNLHEINQGAFTGEISAEMLKEAGAKFVILGHSERRHLYAETDESINKKVQRALQNLLLPIVCVGETLDQRETGKTNEVIHSQINTCLKGLTADQVAKLILAYEPVWAIGTGKTATPDMAQRTQHFCRTIIAETWSQEVAEKMIIQYGGSVKPENAKSLLDQPDIDGLLVGGASLEVDSFSKIINSQNANITC